MKRIKKYLMAFLILIFSLIIPSKGFAKTIPIIGNQASDAIVSTSSGENVTNKDNLDKWKTYFVDYNFTIPNGENIQSGDVANFYLPSNVEVIDDTKFPVKDKNKNIIGEFEIKKGQKIGVLTFNDYLEKHKLNNVKGNIYFAAAGTKDISSNNFVVNKSSWLNDNKTPTWDILYNPNAEKMTNVNIIDTLGPNQEFTGDVILQYGKYVPNGEFQVEKQIINPKNIKIVGNKIYAHFDNLDSAIQIVYHSKPIKTNNDNLVLTNQVLTNSDQIKNQTDSAKIIIFGSGDISGNIPSKPSISGSDTSSETTNSDTSSEMTSSETTNSNTSLEMTSSDTSSEITNSDTSSETTNSNTSSEMTNSENVDNAIPEKINSESIVLESTNFNKSEKNNSNENDNKEDLIQTNQEKENLNKDILLLIFSILVSVFVFAFWKNYKDLK